jgi:hypothetical protein
MQLRVRYPALPRIRCICGRRIVRTPQCPTCTLLQAAWPASSKARGCSVSDAKAVAFHALRLPSATAELQALLDPRLHALMTRINAEAKTDAERRRLSIHRDRPRPLRLATVHECATAGGLVCFTGGTRLPRVRHKSSGVSCPPATIRNCRAANAAGPETTCAMRRTKHRGRHDESRCPYTHSSRAASQTATSRA